MNLEIRLPDIAVKYILFQRTGYLALPKTRIYNRLNKYSPWPLYNKVVLWESILRRNKIKGLFNSDMASEYESIRSHLPEKCSRILDIGCGVAGIDVLLNRHYSANNSPDFYLLDKTEVAKDVYYFFEKTAAFYNSLELAGQILYENGIPKEKIHLIEVTPNCQINVEPSLDLVISLISWGFHYPVSTYLDQVYDLLKEGGHLIMDIRKDTGGEKEIERKFSNIQIISEDTFLRVLAIK